MPKYRTYIFEKDLIPTLKKTKWKHKAEIIKKLKDLANEVYASNPNPQLPISGVKHFPGTSKKIVAEWAGFGRETCSIRGVWTKELDAEYSEIENESSIEKKYKQHETKSFEKIVLGRYNSAAKRKKKQI